MNVISRLSLITIFGLAALTGCGKKKFKPKNLKSIKTEYAQFVEKQGDIEVRVKKVKPAELKKCFRWHVRKRMAEYQIVQMTIVNSGFGWYGMDKKKTNMEDLPLDEIYDHVKYRLHHYLLTSLAASALSTASAALLVSAFTTFTWGDAGILFGLAGFTNLLTIPYTKTKTNRHLYKQLLHTHFTSDTTVKAKDTCNVLVFFPVTVPLTFSVGLKNRNVENDRVQFAIDLEHKEKVALDEKANS